MTTVTRTITEDDAKAALQRAVEEYGPDWVDPHSRLMAGEDGEGCVNVYDWDVVQNALATVFAHPTSVEPRRCIAAQALSYLGVDDATLQINNDYGVFATVRVLQEDHGVDLTFEAEELLRIAQREQDEGTPWGAAVSAALREANADPEEDNLDA